MWTAQGTIVDTLDPQGLEYVGDEFVDSLKLQLAELKLSSYKVELDEDVQTSEITSISFALVPLFYKEAAQRLRGQKVKCDFEERDDLVCVVTKIHEPAL